MTRTAVASSGEQDSRVVGRQLGEELVQSLQGAPDAVVVFASPRHDARALLTALNEACRPGALVGSSSAGEFTHEQAGEGRTCALAIRSDELRFQPALGRGVSHDPAAAAAQLASAFQGIQEPGFPHRSALLMTDALAGFADNLLEQLTRRTAGGYQFFGGGAGDDARFERTHVFHGLEAHRDAVVGLEILSVRPLGIGVGHGWVPDGPALRVTASERMVVSSLNGLPAVEAFEEHAARTGQSFDPSDPLPFFLHNILGIDQGDGNFRLRVPLSVRSGGGVVCAAEVPTGSIVRVMRSSAENAIAAASRAARAALQNLQGGTPAAALFFDCVATRLRLGAAFGDELASLRSTLPPDVALVGCNTYGQIARAEGQFGGFHNCTAVVCLLPG